MEWSKTVWESVLEEGCAPCACAVDTHAITSHYALPLLIRRPGGLVVEVTDGTDDYNASNYRVSFFYDLAKAAVNRMAFALAHELGRTAPRRCRSPRAGCARRPCSRPTESREASWRDATKAPPHFAIAESPRYVGRAVAALAGDPDVARWNGKSVSSGELAKVYGFTDLDGGSRSWRTAPFGRRGFSGASDGLWPRSPRLARAWNRLLGPDRLDAKP